MSIIFEFDRYINGTLMAEGVSVEKAITLEQAMAIAARIASRGKNGEPAVLVYRPAPSPDMREAVEARPGGSTTAFTRDQLARLAFVVFYSPVLCASQNIKAVADEIDCCPGCDHVSSGGTCHVSYRGDYCPNDLADTLRQIGVALYGPGNPSHYVESVFGPDQMPVFRSPTGATP